ncbi:HNH endonuclease [Paeniglutamicibacter antarcticus]|uniref:HNH endonuclease n=1 Tax=Arthrobacter terrae TaxID=2935737 RepID=A0A931CQ52_9MICC|nr:HNH endonuclease family protein [Arthrobacter terrae]MBG0738954.1 HNH endonuclease [Arthrobacter terrae]
MRDMKITRSAAPKSVTALTALFLAATLAGCSAAANVGDTVAGAVHAATSQESAANSATPAEIAEAVAELASIPVKGKAPKTGYSREQFGAAWSDVDHNGCDTRNDILRRDLTNITVKPGTKNCIVASGKLADEYTGKTINFTRGADSSAVQIDHIVALSSAWQTGAQQISADQRLQLANDPLNLIAADGPANQQKSDSSADAWLPANKAFRCEYVARQTAVKTKYKLWMTQPEHDAIAGILAACN